MVDPFTTITTNQDEYCSQCGRKMQWGASSKGDFRYCHHGHNASGTYDSQHNDSPYPKDEGMPKEQLFLIERRNEQMKRAWKRDQYAKVKGKFRI